MQVPVIMFKFRPISKLQVVSEYLQIEATGVCGTCHLGRPGSQNHHITQAANFLKLSMLISDNIMKVRQA